MKNLLAFKNGRYVGPVVAIDPHPGGTGVSVLSDGRIVTDEEKTWSYATFEDCMATHRLVANAAVQACVGRADHYGRGSETSQEFAKGIMSALEQLGL